MNKFFILFLALFCGLFACKKDSGKTPDPIDEISTEKHPLLFGETRVTDAYYVTTAWQGTTRDTSIVAYKHKNLIVTGFYERPVVSPEGIARGIAYYGNEVIAGRGSRLCQFLEVSKPFAETTGRELDPRYVEWSQGSTSYNGDTYIIALGTVPGQRARSYYYKVSNANGKPTFHPLAQTPNGNGYAWYCGTGKGLIVTKTISPDNKVTFLETFREDNWIQDYKLEVPGYIYIDVKNVFAADDDHLIVIVECKKEGTPITGLYYFEINLLNHTVKKHRAELPEVNFHINRGAYAKNAVYLPYYENGTNRCAYVTLKMNQNSGKLEARKFDLPAKPGANYGSATLVGTNGHHVYIAGEQAGLACYWKNQKLEMIENKEATRSHITKMAVFD
jgi:hypothetical protein